MLTSSAKYNHVLNKVYEKLRTLVHFRCSGGGLDYLLYSSAGGSKSSYPTLCGENGRYSPPVVMFGDEDQQTEVRISVEDKTPRTQWLLHFSFTPSSHPSLGAKMDGAIKMKRKGKDQIMELQNP